MICRVLACQSHNHGDLQQQQLDVCDDMSCTCLPVQEDHTTMETCRKSILMSVMWQADQKRKSYNHGGLQQHQLDLFGVTG